MTSDEFKVVRIIRDSAMGALNDHAQYPQLRLHDMQKARIERIFDYANRLYQDYADSKRASGSG